MKRMGIFIALLLAVLLTNSSCDALNSFSKNNVNYEKILGLELYNFGNSMIVYSGGNNHYDLIFSNDGNYTKKRWSDKNTVTGTWVVSGNELYMSEKNGPTYTITANPEGIIKDGMAVYVNGESGIVAGLFNEMHGTGSGVLDMGYTSEIGKYRVELTGDKGVLVLNFNDNKLNITGFLGELNYEWYFDGGDVVFKMANATDSTPIISKVDEMWWIERIPVNLYFVSDASYVGYMVSNIDYLGE